MVGTVAAVESHLMREGFILRYETEGQTTDGLPGNEGAFLPCSFWYADNLIGLGRCDEARALIERLIGVCTDLGLVSEEYDVHAKRLVGTSLRRSRMLRSSTRSSITAARPVLRRNGAAARTYPSRG